MKLGQYQRDALLVLRTWLNPDDPQSPASEETKEHLRAIRGWLSEVPQLSIDIIDSPSDYSAQWMREDISRRARRIRIAQGRGANSPDKWPLSAG
jgi:hypothetical protein